jgi:hypothetical protein
MSARDPSNVAAPAAGDLSYSEIMSELFNLYCIAAGARALAVEAGNGEIAQLAAMLANNTMGLHNRIDAAICAGNRGAA